MSSSNVSDIDNIQFYKVPFPQVANLVKKRKVFIAQGVAFVPEKEMAYVFVSHFRRILISAFEVSVDECLNLSVIILLFPTLFFIF